VSNGLEFKNWIVWNKQDGINAPKSKFVNGSITAKSTELSSTLLFKKLITSKL
jgi:hypothetical protein